MIETGGKIGNIISNLHVKGVARIFVNSKDRLAVINKITLVLIEKLVASLKNLKDASTEDKVDALSDGYEFAMANLYSSEEVKVQMQEIALASTEVMESVVKDIPDLRSLMSSMLSNKGGYIYTHSMITSFVMHHLIKNTALADGAQFEKINFAIFFHDIFLAQIYLNLPELNLESELLTNRKLDDKQKFTIQNHAHLGAELVAGFKQCPQGADVLIRQHHGTQNGKGIVISYGEELPLVMKIFLIAELFVEEFMKSNIEEGNFNKVLTTLKLTKRFEKSPSYVEIIQNLVNIPI